MTPFLTLTFLLDLDGIEDVDGNVSGVEKAVGGVDKLVVRDDHGQNGNLKLAGRAELPFFSKRYLYCMYKLVALNVSLTPAAIAALNAPFLNGSISLLPRS